MTTLSTTAIGSSAQDTLSPRLDLNRIAGHHAADRDGAAVLTFSDVPSDLFELRYEKPATPQLVANDTSSPYTDTNVNTNTTTTAAANTPSPPNHPHSRRPSPGLAARLKALGFGGTSRKDSPPPSVERVGRLPEEQIRKIEQEHLLASSLNPVVERRGRPWYVSRISLRSPAGRAKAHGARVVLSEIPPGSLSSSHSRSLRCTHA